MKMMCPHCGLRGTAEEALLGKRVRCPECQQIFRVTPDIISKTQSEPFPEKAAGNPAESDPKSQYNSMADRVTSNSSSSSGVGSGVSVCSKCGFALSEQFLMESDSGRVCSVCVS